MVQHTKNLKFKISNYSGGQIIIELLVAFGLAGILIPALLTGLIAARNGKVGQEQRIQAVGLLREGEEAVRMARDAGWNNIATNGTYKAVNSGSAWSLASMPAGTSEQIGDFKREIDVADTSPADPSLKKVTIAITWGSVFTSSTSSTIYLTRWKNLSLPDGPHDVQASGGGFADWCNPNLSTTYVDLSRQGKPTDVFVFPSTDGTGNRVFTGTGGDASPLVTFVDTQVTGNNPSISANYLGGFNDTPKVKVNGVFSVSNYAYLATDKIVTIVVDLNQFTDTTNKIYKKVGSFTPSNSKPAGSVYVVGNVGYAVTSNTFYTFDANAAKSSNVTQPLGSVGLPGGGGTKLIVEGNYAYVSITGSATKLEIINITDPAHPNVVGSLVNSSWGDGRDIFVDSTGTRAYLVTGVLSTQPDFFIINTADKTNPTLVTGGTFNTYTGNGMDPKGVAVVTAKKAVIVGTGGTLQYLVIDISNESSPATCPAGSSGGLAISDGAFAVSSILQADGHAYSYIVTGDASRELQIIEGGPGGEGGGNGTYTSTSTIDAGHDVAFNSFSISPADANVSIGISIKHGVSGSCSGISFSDGDYVTFSPGLLPLTTIGSGYTNPGQCLRYKVTNLSQSPLTFTLTFNYSP